MCKKNNSWLRLAGSTFGLFAVACILCLAACSDDDASGPLPVITWNMSGARFKVLEGEVLSLVPDVANTDETTQYLWLREGTAVGTADNYSFCEEHAGEYYILFRVSNRFGTAEDELKVTVVERIGGQTDSIPDNDSVFAWRWPFTEMNIPVGRSIHLTPYCVENADGATYLWADNGTPVAGTMDYVFTASEQGLHTLTLTLSIDTFQVSQDILLRVCPPAGTYRREATARSQQMVTRIFEFVPAPGHQVNGYRLTGDAFPANCSHEEACDTVLQHFLRGWSTSLGACGGYLVAGFDHSVAVSGNYDLCIKGNPFDYQSEPGIIYVSQDVNGDGLPNDIWYELAGSEYGTESHTTGYAVTYYRPSQPHSATVWKDNKGGRGEIPYMSYWNPNPYYWQDWIDGSEKTYFGSCLASHVSYSGGISDLPPYPWGYADNLGSDYRNGTLGRMGYYKVENARTWDGQPAALEYFDFVKVQTAITGATPNLGEASTEVYGIFATE